MTEVVLMFAVKLKHCVGVGFLPSAHVSFANEGPVKKYVKASQNSMD
jgi:hypothetical protein